MNKVYYPDLFKDLFNVLKGVLIMSRKSIKSTSIISTLKISMKKGMLYLGNFSFPEIFDIINNRDNPFAPSMLLNFLVTGVSLLIMAQIRISVKEETTEYVDKLPSYRDIKRKIIAGYPGRLVAAAAGIASAMPYLMQDPTMVSQNIPIVISQIIYDMANSNSPNTRRIKPSIVNWQEFSKGEMGSFLGQLISCPATNLKLLNIDGAKVKNYTLNEAIDNIGFTSEFLTSYDITLTLVQEEIRKYFTINSSGILVSVLEYEEPKEIFSNIQTEILSDTLVRIGNVNTKLEKSLELNSPISKIQIEKYLSKYELIAYNFALKSGDKNILKKYIHIVKQRFLESNLFSPEA